MQERLQISKFNLMRCISLEIIKLDGIVYGNFLRDLIKTEEDEKNYELNCNYKLCCRLSADNYLQFIDIFKNKFYQTVINDQNNKKYMVYKDSKGLDIEYKCHIKNMQISYNVFGHPDYIKLLPISPVIDCYIVVQYDISGKIYLPPYMGDDLPAIEYESLYLDERGFGINLPGITGPFIKKNRIDSIFSSIGKNIVTAENIKKITVNKVKEITKAGYMIDFPLHSNIEMQKLYKPLAADDVCSLCCTEFTNKYYILNCCKAKYHLKCLSACYLEHKKIECITCRRSITVDDDDKNLIKIILDACIRPEGYKLS